MGVDNSAALKRACMFPDNRAAGFRWKYYEGKNDLIKEQEMPLLVLLAMLQTGDHTWVVRGEDMRYFVLLCIVLLMHFVFLFNEII